MSSRKDDFDFDRIADLVRQHGASLEPGLSQAEVDAIEAEFSFTFPDDLRKILSAFLPRGYDFPDWRSLDSAKLRERLAWPADGIVFDIEHNDFWMSEWGTKPVELSESIAIARDQVSAAPALIPIFSHRYLPSEPSTAGNPVYSVHQTDMIFYGVDLQDYFENEFASGGRRRLGSQPTRRIRFWSELVR